MRRRVTLLQFTKTTTTESCTQIEKAISHEKNTRGPPPELGELIVLGRTI